MNSHCTKCPIGSTLERERERRGGSRVSITYHDSLSLLQGTGGAPAVRITGSQPVNDKKSGGCC